MGGAPARLTITRTPNLPSGSGAIIVDSLSPADSFNDCPGDTRNFSTYTFTLEDLSGHGRPTVTRQVSGYDPTAY